MWGSLGFLLFDSFIQARRSVARLSTPNCLPLHDKRELGAIKEGSWIEGNVIMISQKNHKLRKIEQLGEYRRGNMQITKTPSLNKMYAMKKQWWK